MIAARWGAFVLMVVCLAVCWHRQLYDGVWLIGLLAALVFLATCGLFSSRLWIDGGTDSEPSRLDKLDRPSAAKGVMVDESLAGRVDVPVARQVLWCLGDTELGTEPLSWRKDLIRLIRGVVHPGSPAAEDALRSLRDEFPAYVAAVEAVAVYPRGEVDPEPLRRLVKNAMARYA